ncbi:hypothetical protein LXA43DRAFT_1109504 [Ganoderma leucocontextum]|nr:hypothetical protein LXA43DRAFT_1109504 [Ganoderma leucocontextum]
MGETGHGPPATPDNPIKSSRDSDIWFEDRNVVVIAQNTAFRFHKSRAAVRRRSRPSMASCPTVHVSDTSYDFRELLRVIYGGVSHLHPDKPVTFAVLAALAQLSHKYQLDQLLEEAVIHRLKGTVFTTELEVRDKSDGGFADGSPPLELESHHAIEALNLFRVLDRPEMMMPVALYQCCQLEATELVHGVTESRETRAVHGWGALTQLAAPHSASSAISTVVFNATRGAQGAEPSRATHCLNRYKNVMCGPGSRVWHVHVGVVGHQKGDVDAESEKAATDDVDAVAASWL